MIVAATGHRLHLLPGYRGERSTQKLRTVLLETAVDALTEWHPDEVISGMATGWDMAVAAAAMFFNIPFRAYVPFVGQEKLWGIADQTMYRSLLEEAAEVRVICPSPSKAAYITRDEAMVDDAERLLALYCGDPRTGTGLTLAYADGWCVPWSNYATAFMEKLA